MEALIPDQAGGQALEIGFAKIGGAVAVLACAYGLSYLLRVLLDKLALRFPSYRLLLKRLQPISRIILYAIAEKNGNLDITSISNWSVGCP